MTTTTLDELDGKEVTAKRFDFDGRYDAPTDHDFNDGYADLGYDSPDLEGVLVIDKVPAQSLGIAIIPAFTQYLVGGQLAEPDTIKPKTQAAGFNEDEPRAPSGEWGSGGAAPVESWQTEKMNGFTLLDTIKENASSKFEIPEEFKSFNYDSGAGAQVFRYLANSNRVNGYLRTSFDAKNADAKTIRAMDKTIATSTTKEPVTVFRGMVGNFNFKVGDTIGDKGYWSTSMSKPMAADFTKEVMQTQSNWEAQQLSKGGTGALFQISLPTGSNAFPVWDSQPKLYGAQAEVILPHDSSYQVTAIDRTGDVPVYHLRPA